MSDQTPTTTTTPITTTLAPLANAEVLAAETALNPDKSLVAKIKADIDITDRAQLISFGDSAQREVAAFADRILAETLNKDTGPVGGLLSDMMLKVKGLDPKSLEKLGFFERIFGGAKAKVERFKSQFTNVAAQIDRIALEL